jgi:hypothetical protein
LDIEDLNILRYCRSRIFTFLFFMLKISRIRPTKVVVFSTSNPTKFVWHFSELPTIFYAFYKFLQTGYTIEVSFCTGVLRIFYSLTDMPLVCTKLPTKNSGLAIGPLAMGGGGLTGNSAAPAALPAG